MFSGATAPRPDSLAAPFANAENVIREYNQLIANGSLNQQNWKNIIDQCDDSLKNYLTSIKGANASMAGYTVSLQGHLTGFQNVSKALRDYNSLSRDNEGQTAFAAAIAQTNRSLGNYLLGLQNSTASLGGYIVFLITATFKTIALQVATIALNSVLTMGTSLIISGVINAISSWIHHTENMVKAAEEASDKINSLNNEFKSNQTVVAASGKKFAELAQGVDILTGANLSLSTEDYEEFLSLSNKLAEVFPTLNRIYDKNGNAIVQLTGNVETVTGTLQNLLDVQRELYNDQILELLPQKFEGVHIQNQKYKEELATLNDKKDALTHGLNNFTEDGFKQLVNTGISNRYLELTSSDYDEMLRLTEDYSELLNNAGIEFSLTPIIQDWSGETDSQGQLIREFKQELIITASDEDIKNAESILNKGIQSLAQTYENDLNTLREKISQVTLSNNANWSSLGPSISAWLYSDPSLKTLDNSIQSIIQQTINNLSWSTLDFSSFEEAQQYIRDNIISIFAGLDQDEKIETFYNLLDLKIKTETGKAAVGSYLDALENFKNSLNGIDENTKLALGSVLNITSDNSIDISTMLDGVKSKLQNPYHNNVETLSLQDLQIANDNIKVSEGSLLSWDELLAKIENYKELLNDSHNLFNQFTTAKDAIDNLTSSIASASEAYSKLLTGSYSSNELLNSILTINSAVQSMGGELNWEFIENQENALHLLGDAIEYISDKYADSILNDAGIDPSSNFGKILSNSITETYKVEQGLKSLNTQIDSLQNAYISLNDIVTAYNANGYLTFDQLQSLLELSPQYLSCLDIENGKLRLNQEAIMEMANLRLNEAETQVIQNAISQLNNLSLNNQKNAIKDTEEAFTSASAGMSVYNENLKNLLLSASIGAGLIEQFNDALTGAKKDDGSTDEGINNILENTETALSLLNNARERLAGSFDGIMRGPSQAASSSVNESKKEFNWLEIKLNHLKALRDAFSKKADSSYLDYLGIAPDDLEQAREILSSPVLTEQDKLNTLSEIARKAGLSISELEDMVINGTGTESRESFLSQVLKIDKELIEANKTSLDNYKSAYESKISSLSPEFRSKIEHGDINSEEYSGGQAETIQAAIDAYKQYQDALSDQSTLEQQLYDDTKKEYDNRIAAIDAQNQHLEKSNSLIEAQIDYLKSSGELISASSYEHLIANTEQQISNVLDKQREKEAELNALQASGMDENSEDYHSLKDDIADCEEELLNLKKAQEEYNFELLNLPINNLDILINMYSDITGAIENWGAELEASGQKLNADYYQSLISTGATIIDQYKEQADLVQNVMQNYTKGSDRWQELYNKLQSINGEISSMVQNLYQWNEALLQMPLDSINAFTSHLEQAVDGMEKVLSDYDTVISSVTSAIQDQIDALQKDNDLTNETYQNQINALQDQLDLLDKTNEKRKLRLAYEQALYDLEKARNQKTTRVIRDGEITYEKDAESERNAQEALKDAEYNLTKNDLEEQIENLQTELDGINESYDDQIEKLEKISEKWSEIKDNAERVKNDAVTSDYLGSGWKSQILSGNDGTLYSMFKSMYESLSSQKTQYDEQIESTQNIYSLLESYITSYKEGAITYQQAMTGIHSLLSQLNQSMSAVDHLQNVFDYVGAANGTAANAESILSSLKNSLSVTADELVKSLEQYNENAGMITEYTTSWEQLTDNVASMKDILEDVRDNLEDALDDLERSRDDDDEDDGKSHIVGHGYKDTNEDAEIGPGVNMPVYADGILKGAVGKESDNSFRFLKYISTNHLKDGEIPIIAHNGEAVINQNQQKLLLENIAKLWGSPYFIPNFTTPDLSGLTDSIRNGDTNIEVNMGDITLPNVHDADDFAKTLGTQIRSSLRMELGRR